MAKLTLTSVETEHRVEDSGVAQILEVYGTTDDEPGIWVELNSWDPRKKHEDLQPFLGKRLRITIETID